MAKRAKKPYVCHACEGGHHMLCASDLDPKKPCVCDEVWHVEVTKTKIIRCKGTVRQEIDRPTSEIDQLKALDL
jgi:hypothetical protein